MADLRTDVKPSASVPGGKSPSTGKKSQPSGSPRQSPQQSPQQSPRQISKMHSDSHRELPPGWERLYSERGIYYWNKKDGKTTWKFPEDEGIGPKFIP